MIQWDIVLTNSLLIVGAACILAVISFQSGGRQGPAPSLGQTIRQSRWARAGALLVCVGLVLSALPWAERGLAGLLGLSLAYTGSRGPRDRAARPAPAPLRADRPPRVAHLPHMVLVSAEWVARTELLWLALLSPLFIFPAPDRTWVLLALPVLWVARGLARQRLIPRTPLDSALLLLLVMVLVSLWATFDVAYSLGKVAGLLFGIAVYYALVEWLTTRERLRRITWGYLLAGGALAVVGLLGTEWPSKFTALGQVSAYLPTIFHGLPGAERGFNSNEVAGALLWVLPLQLTLAFGRWARKAASPRAAWAVRGGLAFLVLLSAGTLLVSQSRTALVGFVAGMLLLAWLTLPRIRPTLLALLLVGIGVFIFLGPQRLTSLFINAADSSDSRFKQILALESRPEIWGRAVYSIQDFPITGMGMNSFRVLRLVMYPSLDPTINSDLGHAHNQFLQTGVDLGLPGLVAYLAIWMVSAALVVGAWPRCPDPWMRALLAGISTALAASFIFGLADTVALGAKPGIFFWALLALLVACWRETARRSPTPPQA